MVVSVLQVVFFCGGVEVVVVDVQRLSSCVVWVFGVVDSVGRQVGCVVGLGGEFFGGSQVLFVGYFFINCIGFVIFQLVDVGKCCVVVDIVLKVCWCLCVWCGQFWRCVCGCFVCVGVGRDGGFESVGYFV